MCVSCQRGGTLMKILCKKACGPLTSGCHTLTITIAGLACHMSFCALIFALACLTNL